MCEQQGLHVEGCTEVHCGIEEVNMFLNVLQNGYITGVFVIVSTPDDVNIHQGCPVLPKLKKNPENRMK